MPYQSIIGVGIQQLFCTFSNFLLVITRAFLPYILFNPDSRNIESLILPAYGCITKKRKGMCIRFGFISGKEQSGMGRGDKSGYSKTLSANLHLSRFSVDADPKPSRKFVQRASFR